MEPHEVMGRTARRLWALGPAYFFAPEAVAAAGTVGLDGFRFYFLGRGGVLGDAEWQVVRSAFGYFHPAGVERMWTTGVERAKPHTPRDVARAMAAAIHAQGRTRLAATDGLDAFAEAAAVVIDAVEGAAMPLFAAWRVEPVPDDPAAAAIHLAHVLRELRGGAHLVAVVASGLATPVAHAIASPDQVELFGWRGDDVPSPTDAERAAWERAEALTDAILAPAYARLSDAQAEALVTGTAAIAAAFGL